MFKLIKPYIIGSFLLLCNLNMAFAQLGLGSGGLGQYVRSSGGSNQTSCVTSDESQEYSVVNDTLTALVVKACDDSIDNTVEASSWGGAKPCFCGFRNAFRENFRSTLETVQHPIQAARSLIQFLRDPTQIYGTFQSNLSRAFTDHPDLTFEQKKAIHCDALVNTVLLAYPASAAIRQSIRRVGRRRVPAPRTTGDRILSSNPTFPTRLKDRLNNFDRTPERFSAVTTEYLDPSPGVFSLKVNHAPNRVSLEVYIPIRTYYNTRVTNAAIRRARRAGFNIGRFPSPTEGAGITLRTTDVNVMARYLDSISD